MKLSDLQPNIGQLEGLPANPRYIEAEDFEQLKLRLLRMPQYLRHNQLKVEEHGVVLGGNQRYAALIALAEEKAVARWTDRYGVEHTHYFTDEIPDEWIAHCDDYTLEDKRRIVLLDNAQNGKDDLERLANEWSEAEINDWGNGLPEDWNQGEAEDEEDLKVEDDEFNEEEEYIEPRTKVGDIWQLGEHRLLCGDSCSKENIVKLMNGTQARLWLTDPPYNVNVKNSQNMKIANDNMESQLFGKFLRDAFSAAEAVLEPGGSFYVWFASKEHINFESALNACGLHVRQEIVWNKSQFILGRSDYQWKHEPCLYGWKDGAAHYFTESRNRTSVIQLAQSLTEKDIEKMKKEDMVVMLKAILALPTSVINANKPNKNTDHPTMKPLELFGELMKNSSVKGDPVLDTFGGSGTTLICAEQLKRKCYMVELDPHYCDVIIARWEKLTGKEAVKL